MDGSIWVTDVDVNLFISTLGLTDFFIRGPRRDTDVVLHYLMQAKADKLHGIAIVGDSAAAVGTDFHYDLHYNIDHTPNEGVDMSNMTIISFETILGFLNQTPENVLSNYQADVDDRLKMTELFVLP